MSNNIILPLTKSPHSTGRVGPREKQDWYKTVLIAKKLRDERGGKILVLTNGRIAGEKPESDFYTEALKEIGVSDEHVVVVKKAQETTRQLKIATRISKDEGAGLTIISTFAHYPRVRWLCRGVGAQHYIAWGIPRPKEFITDLVLIFLFPLIDIFGLRAVFLKKVQQRRKSGVL